MPWKRQLTSQASELFARGKGSSQRPTAKELYRVIGQLTVEKDFQPAGSVIECVTTPGHDWA